MELPTAAVVAEIMSSVTAVFTAFPIISTVVGFAILSGITLGLAKRLKGMR